MRKFLFFLCFCLISGLAHAQILTTEGSTFWIGFMENHEQTFIELEIHITAKERVTALVSIPGTNYPSRSFFVDANKTEVIIIPTDSGMARGSESVAQKGVLVEITGGKKASVFALNNRFRSADATVVLPLKSLGREYYVMSHVEQDYQSRFSQFLVLATTDNTEVEITPSVETRNGRPAGQPFRITLNRGQVYQVQSDEDLTGTKVIAAGGKADDCQNFALFSGNEWTRVGRCGSAQDHLYEQMFPLKTWGKEFVIMPYLSRMGGDVVKILAKEQTQIKKDGVNIKTLKKGEFFELTIDKVSTISGDKPIAVAQFSRSQNCDNTNGDPFMIMVSPNAQRLTDITFNALKATSIQRYYLNVLLKTEDVPSFRFDGSPLAPHLRFRKVSNASDYSYARFKIDEGNHTIKVDSGFVAYVYGFGFIESFGYATGVSLRPLDLTAKATRQNGTPSTDTLTVCQGETFSLDADAESEFRFFRWEVGDKLRFKTKRVSLRLADAGLFKAKIIASTADGKCARVAQDHVWIQVISPDTLSIAGKTSFCKLDSAIDTYRLAPHQADSVVWNVVGGTFLKKNQTDVKINWNIEEKTKKYFAKIQATPYKNGCLGKTQTLSVTLNPVKKIATPAGTQKFCLNKIENTFTYAVPTSDSLQYYWKIEGGRIQDGWGSEQVSVLWDMPDTTGQSAAFSVGKLWLEGFENRKFCFEPSDTLLVRAVRPPVPDVGLQVSAQTLCLGDTLLAAASSNITNSRFRWTLPDGTQQQGDTLKHHFEQAGDFSVSLQTTLTADICTTSVDTAFRITVYDLRVSVEGTPSVCPESTEIGYRARGDSLLRYRWHVEGGTLQSGQGTDSITVNWAETKPDAFVQLVPIAPNGCEGDSLRFPVRINRRLTPERPEGKTISCQNTDSIRYHTPFTKGSSYNWFLYGGKILEGQGSNEIKVRWEGIGEKKIWLEESHVSDTLCNGFSDTLFVTVVPTPKDLLTASVNKRKSCVGDFFEWKVSEYDTAYKFFDWAMGDGTLFNALTADSVVRYAYARPGRYKVRLVGKSSPVCNKTIFFEDSVDVLKPSAVLTGNAFVCEGAKAETYEIENPLPANRYFWAAQGGEITAQNEAKTRVQIRWAAPNNAAEVSVVPQNDLGCFGDTVRFPVRINRLRPTEIPAGNTNLCLSASNNVSYSVPETPGYAYQWQIAGGEILSGNGTPKVRVKWQGAGIGSLQIAASHIVDTLCFDASEALKVRIKPPLSLHLNIRSISHSLRKANTLEVSWSAEKIVADSIYFTLERRRIFPDTSSFKEIKLPFVWSADKTTYFLEDKVPNSSAEIYQYRLSVRSECGEKAEAAMQQSLLLFAPEADEKEEEMWGNWSAYRGWKNGVNTYELWRQTEQQEQLLLLGSQRGLSFRRRDTRAGFVHCFRVAARENNSDAVAWSNEMCLELRHELTIGNVFTPNADGYNDTFFIIKLEMYPENTFTVYNRWGQRVYRQAHYRNNWDGRANGKDLPAGTYFFELEIRSKRAKNPFIKGPVTILR